MMLISSFLIFALSADGLVDIAPKAVIRAQSNSKKWGNWPWSVADGNKYTLWHQGDLDVTKDKFYQISENNSDVHWTSDMQEMTFSWDEEHVIREIVTEIPSKSKNYGYRSLLVMFSNDVVPDYWTTYGWPVKRLPLDSGCTAGRILHHKLDKKEVRARHVKIILADRCWGNHYALQRVQMLADSRRRSVEDVAAVWATPVAGLALVGVMVTVAWAVYYRKKHVVEHEGVSAPLVV